jgi:hypothetical protein
MNPLIFLLGLSVSTVCSMVGLAGGVFIVPSLIILFSVPVKTAIGTSLFAIMVATISATIVYAVQGRVDYRVGLLLDTLDVPGAILGAYLTLLICSRILALLFGLIVILTSISIARRRENRSCRLRLTARTVGVCMLGSFASGIVSGMLGIGGGVVDEAVMILLLGMPVGLSAGTAIFGMSLTTVGAVVPHYLIGNITSDLAIQLGAGCAVGGLIGPTLGKRMKSTTLRRILAAIMILVGVRVILMVAL